MRQWRENNLNVRRRFRSPTLKYIALFIASLLSFQANASDFDALVDRYLDAVDKHDFELVVELLHPDELAKFKQTIDATLNGPNKRLAEAELLPLLGVNSPQQAAKLTAKSSYINFSNNLVARYPAEMQQITTASSTYLRESQQGDVVSVQYQMHYQFAAQNFSRVVEHRFKQFHGQWRILMTPETFAYLNRYLH